MEFQIAGDIPRDLKILFPRQMRLGLPDVFDQRRDKNPFPRNGQLPGFTSTQREKLGNDVLHLVGNSEGIGVGLVAPRFRPLQTEFGQASQLGNRCSQFVGEVRAEFTLMLERLLQSGQKIIEPVADWCQFARHRIRGKPKPQ